MLNTRWTARHADGTFSTLSRTCLCTYTVSARDDDMAGSIYIDSLGNVLLTTSWCDGSVVGNTFEAGEWDAIETAWASAAQSLIVSVRGEWSDPNEP